jgi:hypothetical protein
LRLQQTLANIGIAFLLERLVSEPCLCGLRDLNWRELAGSLLQCTRQRSSIIAQFFFAKGRKTRKKHVGCY